MSQLSAPSKLNRLSRRHRVLIAEDDQDDCEYLKEAFEKSGFSNLQFVSDGLALLDILNNASDRDPSHFPQFILLDLNMPKKSGKDVLREIKNNENLKTIPTIIFSTVNNQQIVQECYQLGANGYLFKPAAIDQWQEIVNGLINYWYDIMLLPY